MKQLLLSLLFFSFLSVNAEAQKSHGNLYHPEAAASEDITKAIKEAAAANKHVLLQTGGNWCVWCYRLHDFIEKDSEIKALVESSYVVYHLNYSKENENKAVLESLGFPQRFGFPVLVILKAKGERIHTQDSALLESGEGYDRKKVMQFFQSWAPKALDPASYAK